MFGILLAILNSAFQELSDSIGKKKVSDGTASYYSFGFLNFFFSAMFVIIAGLLRNDFFFSLASLPTFIPRVILEIIQAQVMLWAIVKADRGAFGPLRTITIPLLLLTDIALGYAVTAHQIVGMCTIFLTIFLLLFSEKFTTKGLGFVLFTAINAVVTISLFKYDITHFNSVEAEQGIIQLVLLLYFFVMAVQFKKENPLRFLLKPIFLGQSLSNGIAATLGSFSYAFAPASVITTAVRASAVLFSILSGKFYFKEQKFFIKLLVFIGVVVGLILLV